MVLPFVRDLFADAEKLRGFLRVVSHLKGNTGRISVSGLTFSAKSLLVAELQKSTGKPAIVVVRNNATGDAYVPVIQAYCELIGGATADSVVSLPARDVLPFQNLSPHPEIQEQRAIALWKIATGEASIIVVPAAASAMRLRSADYYSELGRILRRGESFDIQALLEHLNSVGYNSTDIVE